MKALSIRQPWAWLICHAGKDIENRTWPTKFRGPVLIHAAKGMTRLEYQYALATVERANRIRHGNPIILPPFEELERGGIVGQAEIVSCVFDSCSPWFCGPWGFGLANSKPLLFQPCRGMLGFFDVERGGE